MNTNRKKYGLFFFMQIVSVLWGLEKCLSLQNLSHNFTKKSLKKKYYFPTFESEVLNFFPSPLI